MTKGWQQAGLIFFVLISAAGAFAADESITITTYYPSPYGDYKSLSTTSFTYLATTEGNVGIGTADPAAKLQVGGVLRATPANQAAYKGMIMINAGQTDASTNGLEFFSGGDGAGYGYRLATVYNDNNSIDFRIQSRQNSQSWSSPFAISGVAGNVGIGTGSAQPLGKLVVLGGNVGIGTSQPHELVTVRNLTGAGAGISLSQKAGGSLVALNFISKDEARHGKFDEGDLTTGDRGWGVGAMGDVPDWGVLANDLAFFRYYPYPPAGEPNWATLLTLDYGRPGVIAGYVSARDAPNTSTAQAALDVRGGVKIGYENPVCDQAHAGLVRYNGKWLEVCTDVTSNNNPPWQWRPVSLPYYGYVDWTLFMKYKDTTEIHLTMECTDAPDARSGTATCTEIRDEKTKVQCVLLGCGSVPDGTAQYIVNYLTGTAPSGEFAIWTYRAYCVPVVGTAPPPSPDPGPQPTPCLVPPCYQPP